MPHVYMCVHSGLPVQTTLGMEKVIAYRTSYIKTSYKLQINKLILQSRMFMFSYVTFLIFTYFYFCFIIFHNKKVITFYQVNNTYFENFNKSMKIYVYIYFDIPKLSFARFVIQLVESQSRPCCKRTTGRFVFD